MNGDAGMIDGLREFKACEDKYIDYTPCQDQISAMTFPRDNMIYRERHCPPEHEKLHCLILVLEDMQIPLLDPRVVTIFPFIAPYKSLTVEKAVQNWVQYEGNVFRFPNGETHFPRGIIVKNKLDFWFFLENKGIVLSVDNQSTC